MTESQPANPNHTLDMYTGLFTATVEKLPVVPRNPASPGPYDYNRYPDVNYQFYKVGLTLRESQASENWQAKAEGARLALLDNIFNQTEQNVLNMPVVVETDCSYFGGEYHYKPIYHNVDAMRQQARLYGPVENGRVIALPDRVLRGIHTDRESCYDAMVSEDAAFTGFLVTALYQSDTDAQQSALNFRWRQSADTIQEKFSKQELDFGFGTLTIGQPQIVMPTLYSKFTRPSLEISFSTTPSDEMMQSHYDWRNTVARQDLHKKYGEQIVNLYGSLVDGLRSRLDPDGTQGCVMPVHDNMTRYMPHRAFEPRLQPYALSLFIPLQSDDTTNGHMSQVQAVQKTWDEQAASIREAAEHACLDVRHPKPSIHAFNESADDSSLPVNYSSHVKPSCLSKVRDYFAKMRF